MDIKMISGGDLGGIGKALEQALNEKLNSITFSPATLANVRGLLEGSAQQPLQVGDIVVARKFAQDNHKWPKADERCIVTQVLDVPYRSGGSGSGECAKIGDIALAFVDSDGDLAEFLYDSRGFQKVGSIYDPVKMTDGEVLAVE